MVAAIKRPSEVIDNWPCSRPFKYNTAGLLKAVPELRNGTHFTGNFALVCIFYVLL